MVGLDAADAVRGILRAGAKGAAGGHTVIVGEASRLAALGDPCQYSWRGPVASDHLPSPWWQCPALLSKQCAIRRFRFGFLDGVVLWYANRKSSDRS
jgi:hypothetical protein